MIRVPRATAVGQRGLAGDHRCRARLVLGRRASTLLGRDTPQRQVSLLSLEDLAQGNARFLAARAGARPLTPLHSRRNIITTGVALSTLLGRTFRVGGATCRGTVLATPCSIPLWTRATADAPYSQDEYDAFMRAFWPGMGTPKRVGQGLTYSGLCAEILTGGLIAEGDPIALADDPTGPRAP